MSLLATIAREVGTPAYVYDGPAIDAAYRTIDAAIGFAPERTIAYAVKANDNLAILARLARLGCGADIVSGGELARALKAGIAPERIVYSGTGKREDEIEAAVRANVRAIHVEAAGEIAHIERAATKLGTVARIGVRINPDVDPATHPYIATGLHDTKFGLEIDEARAVVAAAIASSSLRLESVACHIGSQLSSIDALREAITLLSRFARECIERGARLTTLDAGGGFPLSYGDEARPYPPAEAFGAAIREGIAAGGANDLALCVEPGRAIVGAAGVLLTRVLYVKKRREKTFYIVDAAMTELIRPALYGARHPIVAVDGNGPFHDVEVVGPVCETGDFLGRARLPELAPGALIAIGNAGAYGRTMESHYNARPHAAEVMIEGGDYRVVRDRGVIEDLMRGERF